MLTILRVRGASCRDIDGQGEETHHFTYCVRTCPRLTSIARKETTSVVMNLEVTTRCSPMSSLFGYLLSYFCLAAYCSQHVGKLHHPRPGQTPVLLPL